VVIVVVYAIDKATTKSEDDRIRKKISRFKESHSCLGNTICGSLASGNHLELWNADSDSDDSEDNSKDKHAEDKSDDKSENEPRSENEREE
jgi:hypothetical protein